MTGLEKQAQAETAGRWQKYLLPVGLILLALINILIFMEKFGFQFVNRYYKGILILTFINIILAVSLNLINGITGLFPSAMPVSWRWGLCLRFALD